MKTNPGHLLIEKREKKRLKFPQIHSPCLREFYFDSIRNLVYIYYLVLMPFVCLPVPIYVYSSVRWLSDHKPIEACDTHNTHTGVYDYASGFVCVFMLPGNKTRHTS